MPQVSRNTYQFSEVPGNDQAMPVLWIQVFSGEKEGAGMRTEQEIRAKLEELRNDKRENAGRDNRKIYQLALCWVLKEYEDGAGWR